MARPLAKIDPKHVFDLASLGCKTSEMAVMLDCSTDTLERRFAAEIAKGREQLRKSLRRAQIQTALEGNPTMQIWLGKQYLDQKDQTEVKNDTTMTVIVKGYPEKKANE